LGEIEAAENQNAVAEGLLAEMSKLLSQDKQVRKEFSRKLKDATRNLDTTNPTDKSFAEKIVKEIVRMEIKDKLTQSNPDWFQNVTKIIPLSDGAAWTVEPKE
jgi:hypothetical protein